MKRSKILLATIALWAGGRVAHAHMDVSKLPEGPIRDRHVLMEDVGKNAKVIGDAMKSGKFEGVGPAAAKIQEAAAKIPALFPKGSSHPDSRAKPEIWEQWEKFQSVASAMGTTAGGVVDAAKAGSGIPDAAQKMFGTCKSCHDEFRVPDKKK